VVADVAELADGLVLGASAYVPLATQEFAAETIPDAHFTIWPDAGHFGTAKYWSEVLEAITASL
jgi:pimeloyl-ACP methyl ester carboxylesterase